jgi:hypothetical protein
MLKPNGRSVKNLLAGILTVHTTSRRRKAMGKRIFRGVLTAVLTVAMLFAGATPAFAAERPVPAQGTTEYYRFLAKTVREQVEYIAGGKGTPEYKALVEVWYRPILQETDLTEYIRVTARGDTTDFENTFAYDQVLLDEIYRLADELDIMNPSLSTAEKVARIDAWAVGEGYRGKIIGNVNEVSAAERPWVVQRNGKTYLAGPLVNHARTVNGQWYACYARALGLMFLYRLAGAPAISLGLNTAHDIRGHAETAYYLNGEWWFTAGRNYSNGNAMRFLDYVMSDTHSDYKVNGILYYGNETPGLPDYMDDPIVDVNEPWIDTEYSESFMQSLLEDRYVHPEQKLTRGEVAKLLCAYIEQEPMRNERVFSDVPTSHKYAPYIWALNKLGIMTGDGDGTFRPDDDLSMQEFAVVAQKMMVWGKPHNAALIEALQYKDEGYRAGWESRMRTGLSRFDPPENSTPKVFADNNKIAGWAKPAVDEFSRFGVLAGDGNGYLNPTEPLSRLRFLVFMGKLNRLLWNPDGAAFLLHGGVF